MTALNELSLDDARKFVNNGDVTSLELVQACLKQIDKHDDRLNTFIRLESELAQTQAEEFDKIENVNRNRFAWRCTIGHKDMYYRAGLSTTCGSKIRRDYKSTTTSTAIERLANPHKILVVSTWQFAFSPTGHNTHFRRVEILGTQTCNRWLIVWIRSAVAARMAFGSRV